MVPFPTCKKLTYESFLLFRLLRNSSITITQRHLKYSYSKHDNFLTFWNNSSKIMLLSNHNDKCSSSSFLFSFILVLGGILPQFSAKSFASSPLLWRAQQQSVLFTEKQLSCSSTSLISFSHPPNVSDRFRESENGVGWKGL